MKIFNTMVLLSLTVLIAGQADGQHWGDLKMKFVYDGTPPAPKPINVDKDVQFCGKFGLVDEEMVVKNGAVQNVLVFAYTKDKTPPPHPDYAKNLSEKVTLDNKGCRFEPRICCLRPAQTLVLKNSDSVGHNTNYNVRDAGAGNPLIPAGASVDVHFDREGTFPGGQVSCNIHPWMKAYIVVRDTPYMAVSDEKGEILIKNLPVGEWTFQIWHETGYVETPIVKGTPVEWKRGRPDIKIVAGVNDLGEIKFKPKMR